MADNEKWTPNLSRVTSQLEHTTIILYIGTESKKQAYQTCKIFMVAPFKWQSIVLEFGIKNIINILTNIFDVCKSLKYICYFPINFHHSQIITQIELLLPNPLQWEEGVQYHQDTSGILDENNKFIGVGGDIIIVVSIILYPEVFIWLSRSEYNQIEII